MNFLVLLFLLIFCGKVGASPASPSDRIDWPAFMARHDLLWDRLPEVARDAPHFGNGQLGSMLISNTRRGHLRLQVYRSDVQDHRDNSWGGTAYSRPRLLIGEFHLTPVGKLTGCNLRQDLWNAELVGTITTDKGSISVRHFIHADDMAIVTELKPDAGEKGCAWSWHPAPAQTTRAGLLTKESDRADYITRNGGKGKDIKVWTPNPEGRQEDRNGVTVWVQDLLVGGQYATAWQERTMAEEGTRTHIISIGHSYPQRSAADEAVAVVANCQAKAPKAWREAHQRWWQDYYRQSFLSIPDTRLESAYWGTVYRWASSARAGRGYMDTSGIWFQGGGWPYTTTNFNLQACLWGVYAANRLNIGQSLVEVLHRNQQTLVENVENPEWRADSAFVGRSVAPDFRSSPPKTGEPEVGLLPWTLHNAWLQYRYSMDESILRDTVYPLLRRAVNYYRHMTEEGQDGRIHLTPTFSPESGAYPDCNFDLSLFHWGIDTLLWSSARLKIQDPLIPVWKDLKARLVAYPTDEKGFRFGATRTFDGQHRHASHLLMVYPLANISIDQPEWRDFIRTSAQSYGACDSRLLAMAGLQAAPIAAVAGFPELAWRRIQWHNDDLSPAGFGDSSGWCLEGSVAIANSIQSLMIQSHGDRIRVFPAMPKAWADAVFRDLRTEGAFLVSAKREGGKTRWVQLTSLNGEPCRVEPNLPGKVRILSGSPGVKLTARDNGIYDLSLAKGQTVLLAGEENPGAALIEALPAQAGRVNTFGLNPAATAYWAARMQECFAMLREPDPLVEWAGVVVIGAQGSLEDAKALVTAASDLKGSKAKAAVGEALATLLRRFGHPMRQVLHSALENAAARPAALSVLSEFGTAEDLAMIGKLCSGADATTRRQALKGLSSRKDAKLCPVLEELYHSSSTEAEKKEVLLSFIQAVKNQSNPADKTKIVETALPLAFDPALKQKLQELLPNP